MICSTYHGETPDLDVGSTPQEVSERPRFRLGITTILVDTIDDEPGLSLTQKVPALVGLVWKVDEGPVTNEAKEAGKRSLNDEDPWKSQTLAFFPFWAMCIVQNSQRQPFRPWRPLSCISPYARIPAQAEARLPKM